MIGVNDNSGSV